MHRSALHWRILQQASPFLLLFTLLPALAAQRIGVNTAPTLLDVPSAPSHTAGDTLRRALAYAQQMRPAGLVPLLGEPAQTLARLNGLPELHRAAELAALDEDGTLPYHLEGTFTLDGDFGVSRAGTLQADRYNGRWSRVAVILEGVPASTALLDGARSTDDRLLTIPFGLQRLLRAVFDPLGTAVVAKVPVTEDRVEQDGVQLHCTVLGRQPPLDPGMTPAARSLCVDPATGDLRLDVGGYGFRTRYRAFQPLGRRRIATEVEVLQGDRVLAAVHLRVRVAGDLSPFAITAAVNTTTAIPGEPAAAESASSAIRSAPHFCWVALPWQVGDDLETIDAHIVTKGDVVFKQHVPVVVVRLLAGTDGRLADVEVLGTADANLRERALAVLRRTVFRRREWKDQPVSIEGLLVLGTP